jgi:hypothetical protein
MKRGVAQTMSCFTILLLLAGPSYVAKIQGGSSAEGGYVTASQVQSAFLSDNANISTAATPPSASLLIPSRTTTAGSSAESNGTAQQDTDLVNGEYVGISGYQTLDKHSHAYTVSTNLKLGGSASNLGSNTVSGGMNVHVSDGTYKGMDYLLQLYLYYTSNGYTNVAEVVYAACTSIVSSDCEPQYQCYNLCILKSNVTTDIGNSGDSIGLKIHWSSLYGYVFDYKDTSNNPSWWTITTLIPRANYSTMKADNLGMGQASCGTLDGINTCNPVDYAYWLQVGAWFNLIPKNSNWQLDFSSIEYKSNSSSSLTFLDHALTMTWDYNNGSPEYFSYWKSLWVVGFTPCQFDSVHIKGSGSSTSNSLTVLYKGTEQTGGATLW